LLTTFVSVRRSPHQLKFHSAFERATARVIYREVRLPSLPLLNPYNTLTAVLCSQDWGTQRPNIMRKNNWDTCPSEVLIRCAYFYHRLPGTATPTHVCARCVCRSTPRRFGKTYS